jgi:hypothetical protein
MKITSLYIFVLVCISLQIFAQQHPLVGTWELISLKATDSKGKTMAMDTSVIRETKIFSPTHFIYILSNVKGDSLVFNRAFAGTWQVKGDKYIETPLIGSQEISDKVKTDFTWKIEGDKFIRQGTMTQANGDKMTVDALVFQRVKEEKTAANPLVGTWNQLSSAYVSADGTKHSHTSATHTRFQINSPTHWMRISYKDKKYENAMGGAYRIEGNKFYPAIEWASFPFNKEDKLEVVHRAEGDKMYMSGVWVDAKGKKVLSFEDVFQKVGAKTKIANTTSVK